MEERDFEVHAAGGVVVSRGGEGRLRVAVVHRPRHDDWSLPKGKLERGEGFELAALREVEEETGLRCRIVYELEPNGYRDHRGRSKLVRWFLMEPEDGVGGFEPSKEVDELRWLEAGEAAALVDYEHDRRLIEEVGAG